MSVWIKNIVKDLVKKHQTNDSYEIARQMNIYIIEQDLHEDIHGFYRYVRRNKFIFINSNIPEYKKNFVCYHELGHVILHPKLNTPFMRSNTYFSIDKIEQEANRFAIQLMLYDKNLEDYETKFDILSENGISYELERFL